MGLGDLTKKLKDALTSDKAEEVSDKGIDLAAKAASKVTGGKFDDKIADVARKADAAIGKADGLADKVEGLAEKADGLVGDKEEPSF